MLDHAQDIALLLSSFGLAVGGTAKLVHEWYWGRAHLLRAKRGEPELAPPRTVLSRLTRR